MIPMCRRSLDCLGTWETFLCDDFFSYFHMLLTLPAFLFEIGFVIQKVREFNYSCWQSSHSLSVQTGWWSPSLVGFAVSLRLCVLVNWRLSHRYRTPTVYPRSPRPSDRSNEWFHRTCSRSFVFSPIWIVERYFTIAFDCNFYSLKKVHYHFTHDVHTPPSYLCLALLIEQYHHHDC